MKPAAKCLLSAMLAQGLANAKPMSEARKIEIYGKPVGPATLAKIEKEVSALCAEAEELTDHIDRLSTLSEGAASEKVWKRKSFLPRHKALRDRIRFKLNGQLPSEQQDDWLGELDEAQEDVAESMRGKIELSSRLRDEHI